MKTRHQLLKERRELIHMVKTLLSDVNAELAAAGPEDVASDPNLRCKRLHSNHIEKRLAIIQS